MEVTIAAFMLFSSFVCEKEKCDGSRAGVSANYRPNITYEHP